MPTRWPAQLAAIGFADAAAAAQLDRALARRVVSGAAQPGGARRRWRRCCPALIAALGAGARSARGADPARRDARAAAERDQLLPPARGAAGAARSCWRRSSATRRRWPRRWGGAPALLDGLIDATALDAVGDVADAGRRRCARGEAGDDYQARLDRVRRVVGEKRFALGAQIVAGASDPLDVSRRLCARRRGGDRGARRARPSPNSRERTAACRTASCVILALGRLGGGGADPRLRPRPDLSVHRRFRARNRTAPKPLGATLYYNRLAQRVTRGAVGADRGGPALRDRHAAAAVGRAGAAGRSRSTASRATSARSAWTWEHMALTRARPVFGSAAARAAVAAVIDDGAGGDAPRRATSSPTRSRCAPRWRAHKPPHGSARRQAARPAGWSISNSPSTSRSSSHGTGFDPDLGAGDRRRWPSAASCPPAIGEAHRSADAAARHAAPRRARRASRRRRRRRR